jgi:mannose-6-phosphate isomerase-like protein (cupin superfamily)
MSSIAFATRSLGAAPDAIAPDGSQVRVLGMTARGSMALFTLLPGAVAWAVAHKTVEEIWHVLRGRGRIWRKAGEREEVAELSAGLSLVIATGVHFQFRNDGAEPLDIIGVTMPPWPGEGEAYAVVGRWPPTL